MDYINKTSGYWLGTDMVDKYYDPITGLYNKPSGKDLFAMVGYRRAISNFVRIVTNKDIPVEFKGDDSYTDGKSVVLSSNIKGDNFDVAVGLALHEGSHIKLTDFTHLQKGIANYIPELTMKDGKAKGLLDGDIHGLVKNLLNVVEDRRIDHFIVNSARGYKGYYDAMYDHYFNDKAVDKALTTQQWNKNTVEHYMNHVINFINPHRTLSLLPGLKELWKTLDLRNISRLGSTEEALQCALKMTTIIINSIDKVKPEEEGSNGTEGGGSQEPTLQEKIQQNVDKLNTAHSKLSVGDHRMIKVQNLIAVYEEMLLRIKAGVNSISIDPININKRN